MAFEPAAGSRGLRDHVGVLRRRAPIIVAVTLAAVLAALLASLGQPRRYAATAQVLFQQEVATVQDPRPDQIVDSKRLDPVRVMQNEVRLASSELVRDRVRDQLGHPVTGSVTNPRDTDVLLFTATADEADEAARTADAWADTYVAVRSELAAARTEGGVQAIDEQLGVIDRRIGEIDRELDARPDSERTAALTAEQAALIDQRAAWVRQRQILEADTALAATNDARVIDRADPPRRPSQPATLRNVVLAALAGLLLGLAVAYAVDALDDVIRDVDDLHRALALPVLGSVATVPASGDVRATPIDDPALSEAGVVPLAASGERTGGLHVLVVPRGTRARAVRERADALDRLGVHLIGAVLACGAPRSGPAAGGSAGSIDLEARVATEQLRA
ncbi:MAG: Wzz/FepE/Etk N-terminal domain-containing protein [Acidimicrobiales bacterium]